MTTGNTDPQVRSTTTADAPAGQVDLLDPEPGEVPARQSTARLVVEERPDQQQAAPTQPAGRTVTQSGPVVVLMTEQVGALFTAFSKAQGEFGSIEKTLEAKVKSRREGGADYTYTYETLSDVLEAIREPLARNGLAVMQFPVRKEGVLLLRTMLTHSSGQWLANDLTAMISGQDPQSVGSGISYLRRYTLKAILGLAASDEDDDGSAASQARQEPRQAARPPVQGRAPRRSAATLPAPAQDRTGTVTELTPVDDKGGHIVVLSTGFRCGTKDPELVAGLDGHRVAGRTVTLETRASSNPDKFLPILEEITVGAES